MELTFKIQNFKNYNHFKNDLCTLLNLNPHGILRECVSNKIVLAPFNTQQNIFAVLISLEQ